MQLLSDPYMKSGASKVLTHLIYCWDSKISTYYRGSIIYWFQEYNTWGGLERMDKTEGKLDLRSRGLCLVPISCTPQVCRDNTGPYFWTPTYGGCPYRWTINEVFCTSIFLFLSSSEKLMGQLHLWKEKKSKIVGNLQMLPIKYFGFDGWNISWCKKYEIYIELTFDCIKILLCWRNTNLGQDDFYLMKNFQVNILKHVWWTKWSVILISTREYLGMLLSWLMFENGSYRWELSVIDEMAFRWKAP